MNRILQILGISIVAMVGLTAVSIGSTAAAAEFHSEVSNPVLGGVPPEGSQVELSFDMGTVKCNSVSYSGAFIGGGSTSAQIKLKPTYNGCTSSFLGFSVTIDTNSCEFSFNAETGKVDLLCPGETKHIAITTFGCELTIPEQNGLSEATYLNTSGGTERVLAVDVAGATFEYEEHNRNSIPTCKTNTVATTGSQNSGRITLSAYEKGVQKGLWIGEFPGFYSEISNPVLTGIHPEGSQSVFTFDAMTAKCKHSTYTGSVIGNGYPSLQIKLKPTYQACSIVGGLPDVNTNGCEYILNSAPSRVDLSCPGGTKRMVASTKGCEVTIPEQSGLSSEFSYTGEGEGSSRAIIIEVAISGIEYEEHNIGEAPSCKNSTVATTNGTYTGKITLIAENDAEETEQKGFWFEESEFHSEVSSPGLAALQPIEFNDQLVFDAGRVECRNITYSGSLLGGGTTGTQIKLKPTYSECTAIFGVVAIIDARNCEYVFYSETSKVDLLCPGPTKRIVITTQGCEVTIPEQSGLEGVAYTNAGMGTSRDVTIDLALTGIKYEEHNIGFFGTCKNKTVAKANGTYTGSTTVNGETGAVEQKGLWVE